MMRRFFVIAALVATGCLDPLVDDEIAGENVFGDPALDPEDAPHVEDNLELADRVALFPDKVPYLQGYADGELIWYWNIPGPNAKFIVPFFVVIHDGTPGKPIIDVLPGDLGYSPWWRRVEVRTTAQYKGEKIWSRAAIEVGVRLKILAEPAPTTDIYDCPVVKRGTTTDLGLSQTATSSWVWYRNQRVDWIDFGKQLDRPVDDREMPIFPLYILQRINEPQPIYEAVSGVDENGDGLLNRSNNVFAAKKGGDRYSPLWTTTLVRTSSTLQSIDTGTVAEVRDEDQIVINGAPRRPAILSLTPRNNLVNCPLQETKGSL